MELRTGPIYAKAILYETWRVIMKTSTPESTGIPSPAISAFLMDLRENQYNMHSVLLMRHGDLIAEAYAAPYDQDRKHRMYSVSKTFTSMAVGLMIDEGRLSLDDKVVKFFPEYYPGSYDILLESATIYDMLTMRDCHTDTSHGLGVKCNWLESWFLTPPSHPSGTIFNYNTTSTNLLAAIVERLSGTTMTEYLYPRLLTPIGFSQGCYCLPTPDGDSFGGSGIMCTPRDLALLAQFAMNLGVWEGKQLIGRNYMQKAISAQSDTSLTGTSPELKNGYGFQIWRLSHNGFAFFGIFSQIAAVFPDKGLVMVTTGNTADLYDGDTVITNIMERFYRHLFPRLSDKPLPENEAGFRELQSLSELPQITAPGSPTSTVAAQVSGKIYALFPNNPGWRHARFEFGGNAGKLTYVNRHGEFEILFGMGYNVKFIFKDFKRLFGPPGCNCEAYGSAAWIDSRTLAVYLYFTDEEESFMRLNAVFDGERTTILVKSHEGVMTDYGGYMYGYCK